MTNEAAVQIAPEKSADTNSAIFPDILDGELKSVIQSG